MRTKIILLALFLLGGVASFGQTADEIYLQQEDSRITNANTTEQLIATFIANNLNSYSLTQSKQNEVTNPVIEGVTQTLTGQQLQDAITEAKKIELRKLYFQQNPSALDYYTANAITLSVTPCINNNFVNGFQGFSFSSQRYPANWLQYANIPNVPVLPTAGGIVELVSDGFDPRTNNVLRTVFPTTALNSKAIRLNNGTDGNYDVSALRRRFVVNSATISFNFALVLQNGHQGQPNTQSYFQYRLLDNTVTTTSPNYVLVDNHIVCDILDPRFHQGTGVGAMQALYTDWNCQVINTSQYQGKDVTLEILVSDCGGGAHWGYAYLDNFCNLNACTTSSFGDINLNPVNVNCPTFPLNVSGTFTTPAGSVLTSITLSILDVNNNVVGTLTNPTITGSNYTFPVNLNNFGFGSGTPAGSFRFRATAVFTTTTGIPYTVNATLSTTPNVSFTNCISGSIVLNSVNENCPLFPLDVTGTYTIPAGVSISNIRLQIINSSGTVVSTIFSPVIVGNTFSFPVNLANFGTASPMTGNFEFNVLATLTQGTGSITINDLSANNGADVSFSDCSVCCANCCVDNQSLIYPVLANYVDTRQANLRIQATNTINSGAFASYHAGSYVLLKNGFAALAGSRVHVYNVGCTGDYILRQSDQTDDNSGLKAEGKDDMHYVIAPSNTIELVLNDSKAIKISPNPTNGFLKVTLNGSDTGTIQIVDLFGMTVFKTEFKNQNEVEINIQNQPRGIYIVKVISDNQIYADKIIKN
ncbi:T9SS type A sorting domain-containing protein [Flavobacterium sp.]|uniref:T9SS type A sorting domain-containing protein n=1 Tax=Flavobacterium sp. TaxID=239 RepID=UPI00286A49F7|nr:T9SS type A sorting domain-containing protein [Flavobacterium sp.]